MEFLKPKANQMFSRKEYKNGVRKGKVLGFSTSSGRKLFVLCPQPWCADAFAKVVRQRVGPFFKAAFPDKQRIRVLLDSEPLLHAGPAKAALASFDIEALPDWPKYSPDLNPQENVRGWVEEALRAEELATDDVVFQQHEEALKGFFLRRGQLYYSMSDKVSLRS